MKTLNHPYKVVISGNHDIPLDTEYWKKHSDHLANLYTDLNGTENSENLKDIVKKSCTHYLEDSGCEIMGYKIWGSPWQPYIRPKEEYGFNA